MIDSAELTTEEQASVLLELLALSLEEALAQGVELDLMSFQGLTLQASEDSGDLKLIIQMADKPVEVVVPEAMVLEALGEVEQDSTVEESAEGEPSEV